MSPISSNASDPWSVNATLDALFLHFGQTKKRMFTNLSHPTAPICLYSITAHDWRHQLLKSVNKHLLSHCSSATRPTRYQYYSLQLHQRRIIYGDQIHPGVARDTSLRARQAHGGYASEGNDGSSRLWRDATTGGGGGSWLMYGGVCLRAWQVNTTVGYSFLHP